MRRIKMWAVSMANDQTYPWCIFISRPIAERSRRQNALDGAMVFPVEVEFDDKIKTTAKVRPAQKKRKKS